MKKFIKYIYILVILAILTFTGCTKMMEDMNTQDPSFDISNLIPDGKLVASFIKMLEVNIKPYSAPNYQRSDNLVGQQWAGYLVPPQQFGHSAGHTGNYAIDDEWVSRIDEQNVTFMNGFVELKSYSNLDANLSDYYSYGLILKVMTFIDVCDGWGTYPYIDFGTGVNVKWDGLDAIYGKFFEELDMAIDTLTSTIGTKRENRIDHTVDFSSYSGTETSVDRTQKWIKLANTLKARLAMRMSDVDPVKAKTLFEEAANHSIGMLTSTDGTFYITSATAHPLFTVRSDYRDAAMGSDFESFLVGYNDPRMAKWFTPATDSAVAGQYKGVRQGFLVPNDDREIYRAYSIPSIARTAPMVYMRCAESLFLQAEAALKGWNVGGTAKYFYEEGVKASFTEQGATGADVYLTSSASPIDYVDPHNATNNYSATTQITPRWDDATTDEERHEKIMTQKWIANYPNGYEAWADFRRTGLPKLITVRSNLSAGIVPLNEFAKRVPVPNDVINPSIDQYTIAINTFLNGNNSCNERVWWDVTAETFDY